MNKHEHALWLKLLDEALLALGASKQVEPPRFERHVAVPHYTVTTKAGPLAVHPDVPWRLNKGERLRYDCTVFGRFEDLEAGQKLTGHWKWNAHYGPRVDFELPEVVQNYTQRLFALLP